VVKLLERVTQAGVEFVKTEGLYNFAGKAGFAKWYVFSRDQMVSRRRIKLLGTS